MLGIYNKIKDIYSKWLHSITLKQVFFFSILFILTIIFILPFMSNLAEELIGTSESIDTGFHNDVSQLYEIRELYGHNGRYYYVILRITFDLIWPLIYFLFFASITGYLSKHIKESSTHRYINYLPVIALLLDYLENTLAIIFMGIYPYRSDLLVFLIIIISLNKWVWIGFNFLQIVWLSIKRGLSYVRK